MGPTKIKLLKAQRDVARAASLFLSLGGWFCYVLQAQTPMGLPPCGSDDAHSELLALSPMYVQGQADMAAHAASSMPVDSTTVWTLPVVVHIMHRGSQVGQLENVSDAQIHSAIQALNEDFRKVPGTNGDGLGVDVRVEFSLARRTPQGAPTTGIVRVDASGVEGYAEHGVASSSVYPGADQEELKSLTTWFGEDYVNVFVVAEINGNNAGGGVQGFSFTGPTGDARDGVTLLYNAFGTVGTLKPGRELNRTLTHEMGHHLSLFHTFWNTDDCAGGSNCSTTGDLVCDTPPTVESASCLTPSCPDAQVENYMDYTPTSCRNTFTAGQRDRMRTCLSTVRASLLESLGAVPVVDTDLTLAAVNEAEVCSAFWAPQLNVVNQSLTEVVGGRIRWSVDDQSLPPFVFSDTLAPSQTLPLQLPPVQLMDDLTEWEFVVQLADGTADEYPFNDTLLHTLTRVPGEAWTLTLQTDYLAVETGWSVTDESGNEVWGRDDYPFGTELYVENACIVEGCYTLTLNDDGGNGFQFGGSLLLENATGDTLAYLPPSEADFGSSVTFPVCAVSPPGPGPHPGHCHDFNLNGLCDEIELTGCTYSGAPNFNPAATLDDGSCAETCPGDLNGDGLVQLNDLLDFLIAFGQPCSP